MGKLFGTDGVRGVANTELTVELANKLGRYGAIVLAGETRHKPKIIVGTDTRISCPMLECALVAGICSAGADAYVCDVIPTPGIAKLVKDYHCDAGVVISASHNSYEFNGIKFFDNEGFKLPDRIEDEIEDLIFNPENDPGKWPSGAEVGHRYMCEDAAQDYLTALKTAFPVNLSGLKIALDCANGATSFIARRLFEDLGGEVLTISDMPDGININRNCGSTHPEDLAVFTADNHCDIGIAFDGDGDRMLAIDENGRIVDGDAIMAIIANDMKRRGQLKKDTLVITVMSNLGVDVFAGENGITLAKTKVGDRYVIEEMLKGDYSLGGEQSGHIILLDYATTGDGLLSALKLMQVQSESGCTLSELSGIIKIMPQVLKGVKVANENKDSALADAHLLDECQRMERELDGKGRILVRASGTEPLIRVMLEGEDLGRITVMSDTIAGIIMERYGI
ncbi:MAG: phosphoglucosamine mutase [Saccharofermentanales bacterium]